MSKITIHADALSAFSENILKAAGVAERKARLVATSLVAANLRGVDSHGVQLLQYYVAQIEAGDVNTASDGRVISETGCSLHYDAENSLGQCAADVCCDHGIRIAREHGLSLVIAKESNHFGAAAYWAQKYSSAGLIGIVMCNASQLVPPWQGREPRYGTNPICMSVPGERWLLDMATTTVAANKIFKAGTNGESTIPAGWAMDAEGVPTTSVDAALKGLLSPLGGYKGSGLGLMVEILCSVLAGGAMCNEVGGIRIRGRALRVSQMFLGIDVARFMPLEEFKGRMATLVDLMKSTPPAKGYEEVVVAGEPEWRTEAERKAKGIPVEQGVWTALLTAAKRLNVTIPSLIEA